MNDLYQAAVISILAIDYLMLGKKDTKDDTSKHPEVRSGRHRKAGCHCCCIRDDMRVPHQTEDSTRTHQCLSYNPEIESIVMLIGGALVNALAFTSSSYTFFRL